MMGSFTRSSLFWNLAIILFSPMPFCTSQQITIGGGVDPTCAADEIDVRMDIEFDNFPDDTQLGYYELGILGTDAPRVDLKPEDVDVANTFGDFHVCWPKYKVYHIFLTDDTRNGLAPPGFADFRFNGLQVLKAPDGVGNAYGSALIVGDGRCARLQRRFTLELFFDLYPDEISWELRNSDSGDVVVTSAVTYPKDETQYPNTFIVKSLYFDQCLDPGNYEFYIQDSFEDGIFNPGYYRLFLNRRQFKLGRRSFEVDETTPFTVEGPTPNPTPAPIRDPNTAPILPTPRPTTPPPTQFPPSVLDEIFGDGPTPPPFVVNPIPAGGVCFSGDTDVVVRGKGAVKMTELRVGDYVLAHSNTYERVYSFGHRDPAQTAEFLQLLPFRLELSKEHMVFVEGKGALPASMIQIGDRLIDGRPVEEIRRVVRTGVYTPFTPSGAIRVNGVLASNYISLQNSDRLWMGSFRLPFTYQWLSHTLQVPHRIWCHWLERRDANLPNGFSTWSEPPYLFTLWWLNQNVVVMGLLMVPILSMLLLFYLIDTILLHPYLLVAIVLSTMYLRKRPTKQIA